MKVNVNVTDPVEANVTLELTRLTLLIGPNLNGKSILLRCIYNSIKGLKYNLSVNYPPIGECSIDEDFNYVIYIDPYIITYYIYDKYREFFERYEGNEKLSKLSEIGKEVSGISRLLEIRSLSRDDDLFEAKQQVNNVIREITEELKEAKHEEEGKYLVPLWISLTKNGLEWRDIFGNEGTKITELPPSFYPSFVLTATMYSYALSKKRENVLLLLDEPEAFTYPSFAYTLGRIIRHLTENSEYLHVVAITHSWDFYRGLLHRNSSNVKVYVINRDGKKLEIVPREDSWYIPGFSVSAVLG